MFQIGQTSGVGLSSAPSGTPIEDIKNYLTKMAKNAEELPKEWMARTNVVTVATGDDKVLESSTAEAAAAAEENADEASKKAGGACGRNRQAAAKKIKKNKDCSKQSACSTTPDNDSPTIDPETTVPSTADELTKSTMADVEAASRMSAEEFKRNFCDKKPYAICSICQLANSITTISEFDLLSMLNGITDALDALTVGNIALADNLFQCPGMTSDLLSEKLGPLGMVVGPCVAASMIGMTAVCGAVNSFSSIANVYMHTDLLGTVRDSVGRLIGSGGITRSFTNQANTLLARLNLTTRNLYTCFSSTSTKNAYTSSNARLYDVLRGKTRSHELATIRSNLYDKQLERLWERAKYAVSTPESSRRAYSTYKSSNPKKAITTDTVAKTGVTYSYRKTPSTSGVSGSGTAAAGLTKDEYVTLPADKTKPGTSLADLRAQYGDLFTDENAKETSGTKGSTEYTPVTAYDSTRTEYRIYDPATDTFITVIVKSDREFKQLIEKYGTVYIEKTTPPAQDPCSATTDVVAKEDKQYYKHTDNGYELLPSEDLLIYEWTYQPTESWSSDKQYYRFIPSTVSYKQSSDSPYRSDKQYYLRTGSGTREDPYVYTPVAFEDLDPSVKYYERTYTPGRYELIDPQPTSQAELDALIASLEHVYTREKTTVVNGKNISAVEKDIGGRVYEKDITVDDTADTDGPIILPDGSIFEKPVSTDGADLDEIITTPALITRNHLPVSEMAKLYGIGLSVEELTMAYLLDHEINGSILPRDVKGKRIPTVLDTISDDW